jgi:hypothetical protein
MTVQRYKSYYKTDHGIPSLLIDSLTTDKKVNVRI